MHLAGERLTGNLKFTQHAVSITAHDAAGSGRTREDVLRIVQNALSGIHHLEATVAISGMYTKPQWKLQSNLGPQIADGVNTALTQELEFHRQELVAKLDAAVREKLVAMQSMMNERFQESIAGLNLNETQARELIEKVVGAQTLNFDALRSASRLKKFLRR